MGYYTRVLAKRDRSPSFDDLAAILRARFPRTVLSCEDPNPAIWENVLLSHPDGREIAAIEKNVVAPGTLGEAEIGEFLEAIRDCRPASAVPWLTSFLTAVTVIYSFQHLSGTEVGDGADALSAVREAIWACGDAIFQADGEGFSNEDGYHILWQFNDRVSGPWSMAVLQANTWVSFQMDLGNARQRAAFLEGRVP